MEHFYEILWTVVGTIASGLATWLVVVITNWLNKKIKDEKLAKIMTTITELIFNVVQETMQVYVNTMKSQGSFDEKAQQAAKQAAIEKIKRELTIEQKECIAGITSDVEAWISTKIESAIYQLKGK